MWRPRTSWTSCGVTGAAVAMLMTKAPRKMTVAEGRETLPFLRHPSVVLRQELGNQQLGQRGSLKGQGPRARRAAYRNTASFTRSRRPLRGRPASSAPLDPSGIMRRMAAPIDPAFLRASDLFESQPDEVLKAVLAQG